MAKMMICISFIVFVAIIMISADVLATPYRILYDQKWSSKICVKNYEVGAMLTEEYSKAEHLEGVTTVRSLSNGSGCAPEGQAGMLEAGMRSNATSNLHSVWESVNPIPQAIGRHDILSRDIEDLTGIFSVDRFIQLWPNSSAGNISVDWLPCS